MVSQNKQTITVDVLVLAKLLLVLLVVIFFNIFDLSVIRRGASGPEATQGAVDYSSLTKVVVPEKGYTVPVNWGDTGQKLVAAGGIDLAKYQANYEDPRYKELLTYLTGSRNQDITVNSENAYFWVNTLWALGLTQKSDVLTKGVMGVEYGDSLGNFASTGGWTLGSKDAVSLYSSSEIMPLTQKQQDMVTRVSANIYRPCCGNPASFPDCNHGMAILGLLELMASQGATEKEMYEAALAFNSYWFTGTYVDLAYYFKTQKGLDWEEVDPRTVLSAEYSSAQGYQTIKEQIGSIPGSETVGASCGA